jgi:hypothetical protein
MTAAISGKNPLIKRPSAGRALLAGLMLLALVVQGYVTQTHIHKQSSSAAGIVLKDSPARDNYPVKDDPVSCPVCQQIVHAGQFVVPAWLMAFLIVVAVSTIEFTNVATPHYDTVSHNWLGRGPPLH